MIFEKYSDATSTWERYYCQNANFNVMALTDSSGNVVERVQYDPYGKATVTVGQGQTATGNPYLFQGRRWDAAAGLYNFRNRFYSPELGRFVQRDAAGYVDGMNLYEFVGGCPVVAVDPTGSTAKPPTRGPFESLILDNLDIHTPKLTLPLPVPKPWDAKLSLVFSLKSTSCCHSDGRKGRMLVGNGNLTLFFGIGIEMPLKELFATEKWKDPKTGQVFNYIAPIIGLSYGSDSLGSGIPPCENSVVAEVGLKLVGHTSSLFVEANLEKEMGTCSTEKGCKFSGFTEGWSGNVRLGLSAPGASIGLEGWATATINYVID